MIEGGDIPTPTPEEAPIAPTPAPADTPAPESEEPQGEVPDIEEGADGEAPAPELVDVEYEGEKFAVPPKLKDALLRQADYTRKTQEVAETRRSLEAKTAEFTAQQKALESNIVDVGKVVVMNEQLAAYDKVDWAQWYATDKDACQTARFQYDQLLQSRNALAGKLHSEWQAKSAKEQQDYQAKLEAGTKVLQREIPNWSPERGKTLAEFAISTYGLPESRVAGYVDPAEVRVLNDAYLWRQHLAKQRASGVKPEVPAQPVPQVTQRRSPASNEPRDSDSMDTWLKKRNAQLAKRQNGAARR